MSKVGVVRCHPKPGARLLGDDEGVLLDFRGRVSIFRRRESAEATVQKYMQHCNHGYDHPGALIVPNQRFSLHSGCILECSRCTQEDNLASIEVAMIRRTVRRREMVLVGGKFRSVFGIDDCKRSYQIIISTCRTIRPPGTYHHFENSLSHAKQVEYEHCAEQPDSRAHQWSRAIIARNIGTPEVARRLQPFLASPGSPKGRIDTKLRRQAWFGKPSICQSHVSYRVPVPSR